jgi:hypothetical protein
LKSNGTHQPLVYDDDVNLLDKNVNTRNKNKKFPLDSNKDVGVEVNIEKAKYTCFVVSSPDCRIES